MRHRRLIMVVLLVVAALGHGAARAEDLPRILIGVRDDAPPFVWTEPGTGNHLGFFWDICTKAVERARYQFTTRSISAAERKQLLATGSPRVDLLCDPTTITIGRQRQFSDSGAAPDLSFSPIVFVANGTYASPRRIAPAGAGQILEDSTRTPAKYNEHMPTDCLDAYAKIVGRKPPVSPPDDWIKMVPDPEPKQDEQDRTPPERYEVWAFVEGSTVAERVAAQTGAMAKIVGSTFVCLRQMPSHQQAAEQFCKGALARYIGDADIIRASIEAYARRSGMVCGKPLFPTIGSYEPYAFVISSHGSPEFPERFSNALYEMFSDGTIERLFAGHFSGMDKSPYLAMLFQINSIPEGDLQGKDEAQAALAGDADAR